MTRFKWGKAMKMLIAALMVCLLSVLSFAVYNTYDAYTQMMIAQQQQHLLITARAASQNLSLYLSEQIRNVEILTQTPGFLKQFHTYYVSGEQKGLKEHILSYMLSKIRGSPGSIYWIKTEMRSFAITSTPSWKPLTSRFFIWTVWWRTARRDLAPHSESAHSTMDSLWSTALRTETIIWGLSSPC